VDVALINTVRQETDLAASVLTGWPIIQALKRAADRGVKVRICLDGTQLAEREPTKVFWNLAATPGGRADAPQDLKSYQIDGRILRTEPRTFRPRASSGRTMIHMTDKHHAKADWQFTTDDAPVKLKHLYPFF
jgi:hypothetical protein